MKLNGRLSFWVKNKKHKHKLGVTGCATLTIDCLKLSSVAGIISRDRTVEGQEQEKRGTKDLFLDLRQEQAKEDMAKGGFYSAG